MSYSVVIEEEHFKRIDTSIYMYQDTNKINEINFTSKEDAIRYFNSYDLKIDCTTNSIYLEYLSLFENGKMIKDFGYNYEEFQKENNIQLLF